MVRTIRVKNALDAVYKPVSVVDERILASKYQHKTFILWKFWILNQTMQTRKEYPLIGTLNTTISAKTYQKTPGHVTGIIS